MKASILFRTLLLLIVFLWQASGYGQEIKDSTEKTFKNTISINLTNPMIFGTKNYILGYERVLKDYQTFAISIGTFSLPKFGSDYTIPFQLNNEYKDLGIHVATEYRFYLKKENKYSAPRGIYIGPYYSYNYFKRENNWLFTNNNADIELKSDLMMNMHFVGMQLGYQFVLWKRLSLDMIFMGPGIWHFDIKTKLNTSLSTEDEEIFYQKLNELLEEKFPGYDLAVGNSNFQETGRIGQNRVGLRVVISAGFRF